MTRNEKGTARNAEYSRPGFPLYWVSRGHDGQSLRDGTAATIFLNWGRTGFDGERAALGLRAGSIRQLENHTTANDEMALAA